MPWAIAAAVGASTLIGAAASKSAANAQEKSAQRAIDASNGQFNTTREDLAPYREAGTAALSRLRSLLGISPDGQGTSSFDLNTDPIYRSQLQFGLDEGERGINARANASGSYDSGATLKALSRYATDYAGTKANDVFSRLSSLVGTGEQASNTTANAGANNASNLSNLYTGMGNAEGASRIGMANAIGSGINNYMNYSMLNQLTGGGQRGGGGGSVMGGPMPTGNTYGVEL